MTPRTAIDTLADLVCIALVAVLVIGTFHAIDQTRPSETNRQARWRVSVESIDWRAVDVAEVMGRGP